MVLNAFRHQRNLHATVYRTSYDECTQCSTPFGINGIFTVLGGDTNEGCITVLNAFRHQWNLHRSSRAIVAAPVMCSTPFGITGIFTARVAAVLDAEADGAQRLSASQESSRPASCRSIARDSECSTPFGITGIFTRHGPCRSRSTTSSVLNAFRHHRNLHRSWPPSGRRSPPCAQRLSASKESSPCP